MKNHNFFERVRLWRGVFICLVCAAYLTLFVDYDQPIGRGGKYVYVSILIIGIAGMILYFFDLSSASKKAKKEKNSNS